MGPEAARDETVERGATVERGPIVERGVIGIVTARGEDIHAPDRGFTESLRARDRGESVRSEDYDICEANS